MIYRIYIDLYMKFGLYIAEIVKRLYQSEGMEDCIQIRKRGFGGCYESRNRKMYVQSQVSGKVLTALLLHHFGKLLDMTKF